MVNFRLLNIVRPLNGILIVSYISDQLQLHLLYRNFFEIYSCKYITIWNRQIRLSFLLLVCGMNIWYIHRYVAHSIFNLDCLFYSIKKLRTLRQKYSQKTCTQISKHQLWRANAMLNDNSELWKWLIYIYLQSAKGDGGQDILPPSLQWSHLSWEDLQTPAGLQQRWHSHEEARCQDPVLLVWSRPLAGRGWGAVCCRSGDQGPAGGGCGDREYWRQCTSIFTIFGDSIYWGLLQIKMPEIEKPVHKTLTNRLFGL